jgi:type IV pilus assembly protein PilW
VKSCTADMRGFSLVELMVAMTLSLILLAGALSILYSSRLTYTENDRVARVQEAGRTTVEMILRDVRAAGFNGCSRQDATKFNNGLNGDATTLWNFGQPILGHDATGAGWAPGLDAATIPSATTGSDVLVIRTARQGQPLFRTNAATTDATAPISVDRDVGATLPVGQTVVISDCEYASVFAVTGVAPGATPTTAIIAHAAGGALGDNDSNSITADFLIDSIVTPIDTVIYYVRPSTSGVGPALWQKVANQPEQPLVEGIENLQIRYGIDTNNDFVVNQYVTAGAVPNWNNVVSLTLAVLIRSEVETGVERDNQIYNLLGTAFGPYSDRRQRTIYTTTVVLRNGAT